MQTFSTIISDLGGYAVVADALGIPPKTVSAMKSRNAIPSWYWAAIVDLAKNQGKTQISLELLANMRSRERPVSSQHAAA